MGSAAAFDILWNHLREIHACINRSASRRQMIIPRRAFYKEGGLGGNVARRTRANVVADIHCRCAGTDYGA